MHLKLVILFYKCGRKTAIDPQHSPVPVVEFNNLFLKTKVDLYFYAVLKINIVIYLAKTEFHFLIFKFSCRCKNDSPMRYFMQNRNP